LKILFPKHGSGAFLTGKQGAPYIISFIVICFFAGLCASYLLGNNFGLLAIMVLGIAGILAGGAVSVLFNRNKAGVARGTRRTKYTPQIKSGSDYRPKEATRAYAAVDSAGAETSEVLAPEHFAINNNVWFNNDSLEYAAHTFVNVDPTVGNVTTKARLPGHTCAVSAYD
jgi:uncharacterized membrane protein YeaQ/YmgE (transglycosylase-associated protein family)